MGQTYKQKFNKKYKQPINKSNTLKEISDLTGFKLSGLKKIYDKALAARRNNPQSVRRESDGKKIGGTSLKGKMSGPQWAYSRIYSAIMKGGAYKFDKDLLIKK
jgi:hypothetical protein